MLSSFVDGNYNVEQLLVLESSPSNNEFVVRYKINLTKLISSYDNNSSQITGLRNFVEEIQTDSLKKITHFDIIGYSSPDGPSALNKRLASERASDFCRFVDTQCDMEEYSRTVSSTPYKWIDTKEAIQSSNVPNKAEVLSLIESSATQSEIQAQLEKHPEAWDYIKGNILPAMRNVELHIKYNSWKVVENRTLIEEVVPVVETEVITAGATGTMRGRGDRGDRRRDEYCDDEVDYNYDYAILVDTPCTPIDYDDCKKKGKKEGEAKFKENRRKAKFKEEANGEKEKIKERNKKWWRRS